MPTLAPPRNSRRVIAALIAGVLASLLLTTSPADASTARTEPPPSGVQHEAKPAKVTSGAKARERHAKAMRVTRSAGKKALAVQEATEGAGPATALGGASRSASQAPTAAVAAPATSTSANGGGDYTATPLSSASTWTGGASSGSFSWGYPLRVPPSAAWMVPKLDITYDSSAVDGRVSNSNNQSSSIGEGFDLTSSYITRQYQSCKHDGQTGKYDLCWRFDNANLVLNGKATELVRIGSTAGDPADGRSQWRLKNDDGSRVDRFTRTGTTNGDNNGEYWRVTTSDGTRYYFGLEILPGATTQRSKSTWTVPVAGDDTGEPCRPTSSPTFSTSFCTQAWRWNVDLVIDVHANTSSYWYTSESNYYAKNGASTATTSYVRGGYLSRIEYGLRSSDVFATPPQKVTFSTSERCVAASCSSLTSRTKQNWPDVPFDSICASGGACAGKFAPSFFTRKRVTGITTYVLEGTSHQVVDSWKLSHLYLDPGDTGDATDQALWLSSIQHTGHAGTPITLPATEFSHTFRANRVDGATDDLLPLSKPRIRSIKSETGAITTVNYMSADCTIGSKPSGQEDANNRRCYPMYWNKNGATAASQDWFHKYPVAEVIVTDTTGGSPDMVSSYAYAGPGWKYDTSPLTRQSERTWSQWRGFAKVTTTIGGGSNKSRSTAVFLQGMSGNVNKSLVKQTVNSSGINAPTIEDFDQYAGFPRETVSYDGPDEIAGTINTPWSMSTGTMTYPGAGGPTVASHRVNTGTAAERTTITSGPTPTVRERTKITSFDSLGFPVSTSDSGQVGMGGDEICTRSWYARNTALNITSLTSRVRSIARACSSDSTATFPPNASIAGDVISDVATGFDGVTTWSPDQIPTRGLASWAGRTSGYAADGTPSWQTTSTRTFDALGRPLVVRDAFGNPTTSSYNPAGAGAMVSSTVTNAKGHATVSAVDAAWGAPVKVTDANGNYTERAYDALGRVTAIWTMDNPGATRPAYAFTYGVFNDKPSWTATTTASLGNSTSYAFVDSLDRPIQTQTPSPAPGGGRIITDTLYDDRGLVGTERRDYWATGQPSGTRIGTNDVVNSESITTYDGAERPTATTLRGFGVVKWSTSTAYYGDATTSTAVDGGSATRQVTDIRGRVIERSQYASEQPTGQAATTLTTYTPGGLVKSLTGPDGAAWSYTYDLHGRQVSSTDPDSGTTTTAYTALDQVDTTTDARGSIVLTSYDVLGRPVGKWSGTRVDSSKLTETTYDALAKGYPDAATRYVGGKAGRAYVQSVLTYDRMYRPIDSRLTLPADDPLVTAGVPRTLDTSTAFDTAGVLTATREPGIGGLPTEVMSIGYNSVGLPYALSGVTGVVQSTTYSAAGDMTQLVFGRSSVSGAPQAAVTQTFDQTTRRLLTTLVTDTTRSESALSLAYARDDAGNVLKVADGSSLTSPRDTQCFTYDGYRRLNEAWTPASGDCAGTRSVGSLGGPASYWSSYAYSVGGSRQNHVAHSANGNTSTVYAYADPESQHALTSATSTGPSGTTTRGYTYDATGNTLSRPGSAAVQSLTWDAEGRISTVSEPLGGTPSTRTTSYVYDAAGALLIRRVTSGDGDTVLYLGATEIRVTTTGATTGPVTGSRTYSHGGQPVAVRSGVTGAAATTLTFLAGNNQQSMSVALDAATMAITKRYFDPFGAPRGPTPVWANDKGFLNKPVDDQTGLTHIGAREYDPALGRFLSVDPILAPEDGQSLHGYAYANNTPVTASDPTGLRMPDEDRKLLTGSPTTGPVPPRTTAKPTSHANTPTSGSHRDWPTNSNCGNVVFGCIQHHKAEAGHALLDAGAGVPGIGIPFAVANSIWYVTERNYSDAGWAAVGVLKIPRFKAQPVAANGGQKWAYRGVGRDHPGYDDALKGRVNPRKPNGTATPEQHNLGNTTDSPFTSWTRDPDIARRFAGHDGVVLRVPRGEGSPYKFEWSPDVYYEQEILIRGPVCGALIC